MWDQSIAYPFSTMLKRNILMFLSATLVAFFTFFIALAPTALAAPTDADWTSGDTPAIRYDGHQFTKATNEFSGDAKGLPAGKTYVYTVPQLDGAATPKQVKVIYFSSSVQEPIKETSANYAVYSFTPPSTYKTVTAATKISLTPQDTTSAKTTTGECSNPNLAGLGWIICSTTRYMAGAMDSLFNVLVEFLTVHPMDLSQDNPLYKAWSLMRNFANIAFVIAFMIIIYSQLTNIGLSNYGIKQLLPRIIIAAVLVNVSYWICALAIDVSNILGMSIQDVFKGIRLQLIGADGAYSGDIDWSTISTVVLSGTAGVAGATGGLALLTTTGGSIAAALYLLLPLLVGVLVSVFVALIIMAARQALITILVIVAPLAFVAYLLPNTEKLFNRWRETFSTMLFLFPIVSFVFGGSQLAGMIIIQNADSITVILLGMAVQVAPVVITPLLVKFSGSLVGRIAGMVNNPNKGIIDRTRKFADERANQHRAKALADGSRTIGGKQFGTKSWARSRDLSRRRRERDLKTNEGITDNRQNSILDGEIANSTKKLERELRLKVVIDEASAAKERLESIQKEFQAGEYTGPRPITPSLTALMNRSEEATLDLALTGMRKQAAERAHKTQLNDALLKGSPTVDAQTLREYAGGIQGAEGASSVLASSVAEYRKEYGARIAEKTELQRHFELSSSERQRVALGENVPKTKDGVTYVFSADDHYSREAAVEAQLKGGSEKEKLQIIRESSAGGKTNAYHTTISAAIPTNGIASSILIAGGKSIDDVYRQEYDQDKAAVYHINDGKIKNETLATQGPETLKILFNTMAYRDAITDPVERAQFDVSNPNFEENYQKLREKAWTILRDPLLSKSVSDSSEVVLKAMELEPPPRP